MKIINIIVILTSLFLVFTVCTSVLADTPVPATPETQGFTTSTAAVVAGKLTENDAFAWQVSNRALNTPPLESSGRILDFGDYVWVLDPDPPLDLAFPDTPGEVQYAVSYSEGTIADQGVTTYEKSISLDTANQVANQQNLRTSKIIEFIGSDLGRAVSDEDLIVDGAGELGLTEELYLCPFASNDLGVIPQFCNIVRMGSSADMTLMSLTSSAGERHVAASADVPVEAEYSVRVTGTNGIPASGSIAAYLSAHIQEGDASYIGTLHWPAPMNPADVYETGKTEDLVYSGQTTASGEIMVFSELFGYQSGVRRV